MAEPRPGAASPGAPTTADTSTASRLVAVLCLLFNALVWGLSWWPLRELDGLGLHPLWTTAAVYLMSMAVALALWPRAAAPALRHPGLWLLALASGVTNLAFNWAVTAGDVLRVVLLFYLMPAWAVLLAWWLLGERPTGASLLRLLLALAGVLLVLGNGAGWPLPSGLADWLAVVGGLSFALTNVLLRRLVAVPSPQRVMAMFGGGVVLCGVAATLGWGLGVLAAPQVPGGSGMAVLLGLALAFLLANVTLQIGAARLPSQVTSLVMLSEIVFASVSSVRLGAAQLEMRTLAGGALILAAALWSAWPARRTAG